MSSGKFTVKLLLKDKELAFENADIIELNITEDIFNFCMSGNIIFYDKYGYAEIFELTGNERIVVIWEDDNIERKKEFIIYNFDKVVRDSNIDTNINKICLFLLEPIFFSLTYPKYSKAWGSNILISEIIKNISNNFLNVYDFVKFEETKENINNFYMPFWTPSNALNYLIKRSSGANSNLPGFLYYSNLEGVNFITLDKLLTDNIREKDDSGNNVIYNFSSGDFNSALDWYIDPADKYVVTLLSGGTRIGFGSDGSKNYLVQNTYTYKESIQKFHLFGKKTLFTDISQVNYDVSFNVEQNEQFIDNIYYNDFIKRYAKQVAVGIVVKGHPRKYAGIIIDIIWPSVEAERFNNKMYSGSYLVRSITHQFTSGINVSPAYRQLMICLKLGYSSMEKGMLLDVGKNKSIPDTGIAVH